MNDETSKTTDEGKAVRSGAEASYAAGFEPWDVRSKREAEALPQHTRQAVLDSIWAGATLGDVASAHGLSLECVSGVLSANIEEGSYSRLRREAA